MIGAIKLRLFDAIASTGLSYVTFDSSAGFLWTKGMGTNNEGLDQFKVQSYLSE